ncbi:MAG: hypothetical protein ACJA1P_000213 [Maribacter sp.]|jgi:hypothetical protein
MFSAENLWFGFSEKRISSLKSILMTDFLTLQRILVTNGDNQV